LFSSPDVLTCTSTGSGVALSVVATALSRSDACFSDVIVSTMARLGTAAITLALFDCRVRVKEEGSHGLGCESAVGQRFVQQALLCRKSAVGQQYNQQHVPMIRAISVALL
jgi:hypothetical protein